MRAQQYCTPPVIKLRILNRIKTNSNGELIYKYSPLQDLIDYRKEVTKRWQDTGILDGLKGGMKENIAQLFEADSSYTLSEGDMQAGFYVPYIPLLLFPPIPNSDKKRGLIDRFAKRIEYLEESIDNWTPERDKPYWYEEYIWEMNCLERAIERLNGIRQCD
jgi:hypothetical protein